MKRTVLLAVFALLAGCGEELPQPTAEVAAEIARVGVVPDCARLRWAQQQDNHEGGMMVTAQYMVSRECDELWTEQLLAAGFERQVPHGEMVKESEQFLLVSNGGSDLRGVVYDVDHVIDGLHVWRPEEAND